MSELDDKLARLGDNDRAELYRELLGRLGESSPQSVQELVLMYERNSGVDPKALQETTLPRLPGHERPTRYIEVDELPRTPHGKLDRRGLPGLIRTEQAAAETIAKDDTLDSAVRTAVETFRQVLGTLEIGPDSNFFELGGHSLLAVECILAFEEKTGRRISITQFLNHPTPRGIEALLDEHRQRSNSYVYPVSENMYGLPVFVFSASRLAYALKPRKAAWTVYGVQLRWRDDNDAEVHYRNLEDLAARIVAEIRQICGDGKFVLAGSSFPGLVAFEVARQLKATGMEPTLTILIEPSLFFGIRTWIEMDLAYYGRLKPGENPYLRWLTMNNPLRAHFWRRLRRLRSRRQTNAVGGALLLDTREDHEAYETARTTDLWRRYTPSSYAGPAVFLAGAEMSWQMRRNWEAKLSRDCPVHILDTDHAGILTDPFMSEAVVPIVTREVESSVQ